MPGYKAVSSFARATNVRNWSMVQPRSDAWRPRMRAMYLEVVSSALNSKDARSEIARMRFSMVSPLREVMRRASMAKPSRARVGSSAKMARCC